MDSPTVVKTMAKTKTTPRASTPMPVTTAAKWPNKTKKFFANIDAALNIFDDQVSSIDDCCATAYKTFTKAYRDTFTNIWQKINNASIKILLQTVKDAELDELHCMSHLMSPEKSQPTLVKENRTIPTLDNILGSLVNQIPEQKLPDKETCSLILQGTFYQLCKLLFTGFLVPLCLKHALVLGNGFERFYVLESLLGSYIHQESI